MHVWWDFADMLHNQINDIFRFDHNSKKMITSVPAITKLFCLLQK